MRKYVFLLVVVLCLKVDAQSTFRTLYPEIPRIDAHTHAGADIGTICNYMRISEQLSNIHKVDLMHWINLDNRHAPIQCIDSVKSLSDGKMSFVYGNYNPESLLQEGIQSFEARVSESFGYKLWFGPVARRQSNLFHLELINDERLYPYFSYLSENGIPLIGLHIADPNGQFGDRTPWCPNPIEFWRQITAFEQLLIQHPDLLVIAAHGAWLVCQDAQLDYLRYLLSTYSNLYIDIAATFQYFNRLNRENLRDFFIQYSDRILFGTDIGFVSNSSIDEFVDRYNKCFMVLETNDVVPGSFFGNEDIQGLALPKEVLMRVYYDNAYRLLLHRTL